MKRTIPIIAALVVAVFVLSGCSSVSTGPDQVALHYEGGSFSAKKFHNCVDSSVKDWDGPGDAHYSYPASQRNLAFDRNFQPGNPDQTFDDPEIHFVTSDGIEMSVDGVLNFLLETNCKTLRKFHELIGNRYKAYMDGDDISQGWINALGVYIYKPLDTAVDRASQGYTYSELYLDPSKKSQWEQDVQAILPDLVDRQTDGDVSFFKNFAITLQKPEPPKAIKQALEDQQTNVAKANSAKAQADAQVAQAVAETKVAVEKAKQREAEIAGYGDIEAYLKAQCIQQGCNPYQPTYGAAVVGK